MNYTEIAEMQRLMDSGARAVLLDLMLSHDWTSEYMDILNKELEEYREDEYGLA